jgi:hypothetical protein
MKIVAAGKSIHLLDGWAGKLSIGLVHLSGGDVT